MSKSKNPQAHERKGTLSSGVRCLEILRLLSGAMEDLSLQQIATAMKLHPSTTHRILSTLVSQGFAEQQPDRRYGLGLEAFAVGAGFLRRSRVRRAAVPHFMRLVELSRASVNLAFWHWDRVVIVDCLPSPGMYHLYTETGTIVPAHATGMGKCLLAYRGNEAYQRLCPLEKYTESTITSMPVLKKELEQILKLGYALDMEESIPGCRCIAAPILCGDKEPFAAMSISASPAVITEERIPELAAILQDVCRSISFQLGYSPGIRLF